MNRIFTFKHGRSRAIIAGVCSIVFAVSLSAQVTSVRLPTADSLSSFRVLDNNSVVKLRLSGDGGFYAGGTYGTGVIPATSAGARLMWYPAKAAFRAGSVNGTQWDDANVGAYSTAMGYNTTASGVASLAIGYLSTASGPGTVAFGYYDTASGQGAVAIGYTTKASGWWSTAMGSFVSTAGYQGSFIIGDYSTITTTNSTAMNQMTMRFSGGYRLFTDAFSSGGASLPAGGNSWGTISDSTKKTNFVKADHDYFLKSLSQLKLGSWNYKAQNAAAKNYRHYGPMAQEIFHFFGHDGKGTIGCDTLLATADMDGIMMICLQALEKRTGELNTAVVELKTERAKVATLQSSVDGLKAEMQQMKNDILLLAQAKSGTTTSLALNTRKGQ